MAISVMNKLAEVAPQEPEHKVYYLSDYIDQNRASCVFLRAHAKKCMIFQNIMLFHDTECERKRICPTCDQYWDYSEVE